MRRVATVLVPVVAAAALALTTDVPTAVAAPAAPVAPVASLRADFGQDGSADLAAG
jgi:hypothetical protein